MSAAEPMEKREVIVVMEGTGGCEYLLLKHLAVHKLEASGINPKRVRDFAKGMGLDAKTDLIDAKAISNQEINNFADIH
jgi:transposase